MDGTSFFRDTKIVTALMTAGILIQLFLMLQRNYTLNFFLPTFPEDIVKVGLLAMEAADKSFERWPFRPVDNSRSDILV